jgi:hypothetical protein
MNNKKNKTQTTMIRITQRINNTIRLFWLGALVLLAAGLQNCGDKTDDCIDPRNPECENYNPCIDAKPVSAAFHMYEESDFMTSDPNWVSYDTDSSVTPKVRFTAVEPNAQEYVWYIGTEIEPRTGKSVLVDFTGSLTPKRIRLIIKKSPNTKCFPTDNGIDTVDRILYFVDRNDTLIMPMIGKFRGVSTKNPQEILTVQIGYYFRSGGSRHTTFAGFNDCTAYTTNGVMGFRLYTPWKVNMRIFLDNGETSPSCNLFDVICRLPDNSDSIYVQYKQWSKDSTLHQFRGIKIR